MCISAWITRFARNARSLPRERKHGPLTTEELTNQRRAWERRAQHEGARSEYFEKDRLQLNVQRNDQRLFECRERIQDVYPVYLPDKCVYTEKFM